ncbi:uncharacterized protein ACA1_131360, partial [Acanthamoeba castellanii str. Neff]
MPEYLENVNNFLGIEPLGLAVVVGCANGPEGVDRVSVTTLTQTFKWGKQPTRAPSACCGAHLIPPLLLLPCLSSSPRASSSTSRGARERTKGARTQRHAPPNRFVREAGSSTASPSPLSFSSRKGPITTSSSVAAPALTASSPAATSTSALGESRSRQRRRLRKQRQRLQRQQQQQPAAPTPTTPSSSAAPLCNQPNRSTTTTTTTPSKIAPSRSPSNLSPTSNRPHSNLNSNSAPRRPQTHRHSPKRPSATPNDNTSVTKATSPSSSSSPAAEPQQEEEETVRFFVTRLKMSKFKVGDLVWVKL